MQEAEARRPALYSFGKTRLMQEEVVGACCVLLLMSQNGDGDILFGINFKF